MESEQIDALAIIKQLEKDNRILRKKLERAETTCLELEQMNQKKEYFLRQIINELEDSQNEVKEKRQLEQTLIELKQTQAQLVHAEKMSSLGQLVAGVAHEINNPVNFIHGNLTYLEEYSQNLLNMVQLYQHHYPNAVAEIQAQADAIDLYFLHKDLLKILNSMKLGTDRIRNIVLSLRNFSRTDEVDIKPVNIHEGIDSTLMILQHRLKASSERPEIQVIKNYGALPLTRCYAGPLNQVFMNILSNAIDALEEKSARLNYQEITENPSQIRIRTSVIDAEWVEIAIADNGSGIPKELRQRIFEPFFTTKPVGKGTGMGMSISYQIVTEKHGGQLDCFSILGEGTEFSIKIPVRHKIDRAS
ncbi:MAG: sensor histidine kinase [Microcoleus sp. PH2017_10_PVI_O_A]|nr:sensor histidine kinase [Microcoleus sp. PH2017_10_PVI_O_A]MCC3460347.1 sensor histidine kinase [Microcoleus sp. PH2017_11_PCY_U_A]MCC3478879.1 sensor histidine kinase [Microcoleus sp. PH2017_12_PCY_D_A]MCC3528491.1 sensor histidine kinase [Microcoleus sp. PH2017_21_RUC_O_A]MCC3540667.1 sensor histidine kinase [Microcoleus sp. PH2017_22_RUC_O_B]MCC3559814.1 sensor histidine kinase [Microcoleus sp. PH2017_27_LUM_O_A]TAE83119.1 MAG: sensor histidine kinase [Oscillatoriales cyanobacterium]